MYYIIIIMYNIHVENCRTIDIITIGDYIRTYLYAWILLHCCCFYIFQSKIRYIILTFVYTVV